MDNVVIIITISVAVIIGVLLAFIPTIIANSRKCVNRTAIFLINLFLLFSGIGWLVALIWAIAGETEAEQRKKFEYQRMQQMQQMQQMQNAMMQNAMMQMQNWNMMNGGMPNGGMPNGNMMNGGMPNGSMMNNGNSMDNGILNDNITQTSIDVKRIMDQDTN